MSTTLKNKGTKIAQYCISKDNENCEFELYSSNLTAEEFSQLCQHKEIDLNTLDQCIIDLLEKNQERLANLDQEIDRLTSHADRIDIWVSVCSGMLCGVIDSLYVGELELSLSDKTNFEDRSEASMKINNFIEKIAKQTEYNGKGGLRGAISHLEDIAPVDQDNIWKERGISSTKLHHLEDLAHHPTPLGLLAAFCVSFLSVAIFTDKHGNTQFVKIPTSPKDLLRRILPILISGIFYWFACFASRKFTDKELSEQPKHIRILIKMACTIPALNRIAKVARDWALHEISDVGGSKNAPDGGMGIPGLFVSFLKEFAMILPGKDRAKLNEMLSDAYSKNKLDFRSELTAMTNSLKKQIVTGHIK